MENTGIWSKEEAEEHHAFSKKLAELLIGQLNLSLPIIDFGCGNGAYVDYLKDKGANDIIGYDGTEFEHELIKQHDLTKPLKLKEKAQIICLEVGEHIPSKYEKVLLDTLTKNSSGIIILSWAIPGQGGLGHVNEQTNRHVIVEMRNRQYGLDGEATTKLREGMKTDKLWWFANTLMVFKKLSA